MWVTLPVISQTNFYVLLIPYSFQIEYRMSNEARNSLLLFLLLLLLLSLSPTSSQSIESQRSTCSSHTSCSQCINAAYFCGWCILSSTNSTRCIPMEESASCVGNISNSSSLQHPRSSVEIIEDVPLGSSRGNQIVLTKPQHVKLELRLGETKSFNIISSPAPGYPLDLYLLIDLSYSMMEGFMRIQSLSQQLVDTVENITMDYRLGMGSFVDKPIAPFR